MTLRKLALLAAFAAGAGSWLLEPAAAQIVPPRPSALDQYSVVSPKLSAREENVPLAEARGTVSPAVGNALEGLRSTSGAEWVPMVDRRNGFVSLASGGGVTWLPGKAASPSAGDARAGSKAAAADLGGLESVARDFLTRVGAMLGVQSADLVLNRGRSGQPASHVWFVDFDVTSGGTPIEGARVVFRVNNGNLVQFGAENVPSAGVVAPAAKLTLEEARTVVARHIGGFTPADSFRDAGSLHLIPVALSSAPAASFDRKQFNFGAGRGLARVWQFIFHRDGVRGTWRARVDAATGELLEFVDANQYAQATGGVYANSPTTGPELVRPFPFADLSTGGFSNSAGLYTYGGGSLTSSLNGEYVQITDTCGAISLSADGSGNLSFATSSGTDCTTPGVGGSGNTHAAREQFYQVNRVKEVGRGWLPSNTWLSQQLTVNVDLNQTCNAYWNGTTLNFFKSGGGCANTGEISGVSLHEYGHGLDQNDGDGFSPDQSTAEGTADITSSLALHTSCIGPGFRTDNSNCGGYGDACNACTGVRDIDWGQHASDTPHTVGNYSQVRCGAGGGPCGEEGHCGSAVLTESVWDLANRDLPSPGTDAAWSVVDQLWYLSRPTVTASFTCHTGGQTWTSDGCNIGSLWEVFRVLDDDDGNLANGTPHGGALFAALNRHGLACASDPGAGVTFSGCTPPATPVLTVSGGTNQASLSWTASAGAIYDVYRNESGCNATFTRIASGVTGTTLVDTALANGTTYYYEVVAYPAGNLACSAPPTTCSSADLSGPDPSITPWGAALSPPTPPYWQTPDIFVDNNGNGIPDEYGEPSLGKADNQLFARVTNVGNAPASGYRVRFAAKPYTTNASAPAVDIDHVDEAGTLAAGAARTYQVAWDLTATYIMAHFPSMFWNTNHFCVQVTIESSSGSPLNDANPNNNFAQNNFDNIPLSGLRGALSARATFYIYNHLDHGAIASLQWAAQRPGWTVHFENVADPARIPLQPKQWLEVVAVAVPAPGTPLPNATDPARIDITQQLDGAVVGGLTMGVLVPPPGGGAAAQQAQLWLTLTGGGGWPVSSMHNQYDSGFNLAALLERSVTSNLRAGIEVGYHAFEARPGGPTANLGVTDLSLVGRVLGSGASYRPFALVGVGGYQFLNGWDPGIEAGIGFEAPITGKLALAAGVTAHRTDGHGSRPNLEWIDGHLGFTIGLP